MTTQPKTTRSTRRFTVDEYHRMAEAGILDEDDRVELVEGEIVEMTPIGSRHASCVSRLNRLFVRCVGDDAIVWPQNPIRLGDHSEPEPDLALLEPTDDEYQSALPTGEDTLLVVEVADTSLDEDRHDKIPLYADHRIPAVWLVDLTNRGVELHENPRDGEYLRRTTARDDDPLAIPALPDVDLHPSDIFE